jgi:hypothetical protein
MDPIKIAQFRTLLRINDFDITEISDMTLCCLLGEFPPGAKTGPALTNANVQLLKTPVFNFATANFDLLDFRDLMQKLNLNEFQARMFKTQILASNTNYGRRKIRVLQKLIDISTSRS